MSPSVPHLIHVPLLPISSSALPPVALLQGRARLASSAGEGTALPLSPPTPCLLGISQVAAAGLGAITLLSKSEEKVHKVSLKRRIIFFLTSGKASEEHMEEAV